MISDHSQTPNIWPKKPTCGATLEVWGGSAPGMGVASVSFEKMSTSPNRMKFVAKVATNDGTFKNTLIMPLIAPIPMHTTRAATMAQPVGTPSVQSQYMTHGEKRKTCPAERSISPSTSTSTSPTASAPYGPAKPAAELRPSEVRKFGESTAEEYEQRDGDEERGDFALRDKSPPQVPAPTGCRWPDRRGGRLQPGRALGLGRACYGVGHF